MSKGTAGRELFVWYRVRRERVDEVRAAVTAMQRSLRGAWPGLEARLLCRDDGDTATWMETYSCSASGASGARGIDAGMQAAIAAAAFPIEALIEGTRHAEAFDAAA